MVIGRKCVALGWKGEKRREIVTGSGKTYHGVVVEDFGGNILR